MGKSANAPWRDEATLRQKYWVEGKTLEEVGEELGCCGGTVKNWLDAHGLGTRTSSRDMDGPWRDREVLKELYHEKGMSCYEVADELGCGYQTVLNWLERTGLGSRKSTIDKPPYFKIDCGYPTIQSKIDGETKSVRVHRLVAVAHGIMEPHEFFDPKTVIHHENGFKRDNRPGNLTKMSLSEHMRLHSYIRERDELGRMV